MHQNTVEYAAATAAVLLDMLYSKKFPIIFASNKVTQNKIYSLETDLDQEQGGISLQIGFTTF